MNIACTAKYHEKGAWKYNISLFHFRRMNVRGKDGLITHFYTWYHKCTKSFLFRHVIPSDLGVSKGT